MHLMELCVCFDECMPSDHIRQIAFCVQILCRRYQYSYSLTVQKSIYQLSMLHSETCNVAIPVEVSTIILFIGLVVAANDMIMFHEQDLLSSQSDT